ncbi:response regulator [Congregibacter variabilis]|uniref:histidine kinase n=1 Tax=Congregibacter variabilis TaxID=3081200 RepID=A0ABZ0HZF1_9GAMM|nr:response regulator [Congregibacter sp. IMCC43200]
MAVNIDGRLKNTVDSQQELLDQNIERSALRYICLAIGLVMAVFSYNNLVTGVQWLGWAGFVMAIAMTAYALILDRIPASRYVGIAPLIGAGLIVAMAISVHNYGIFWTPVMIVAAFAVAHRYIALPYCVVFILIVAPMTAVTLNVGSGVRLAMALSLTTFFSYFLSRLVAQRTAKLLQNMKELEKANAVKSEFIANMSHEMRTPLTTVLGYSERLLDSKELSPANRKEVEAVASGARQLGRLINDVLDLSRAEEGHLEVNLEDIQLAPLLNDVIDTLEPSALEKGLELQLRSDLPLALCFRSDPLRLRQILMNLLRNAIKFTSAGSVILSVDYDADEKLMRFSVADTGIGIADDFRGQLFQRFSQADSAMNRDHGGTGLGLYISRQLAGLLNGELSYIPQDVGSLFQLSIHTETVLKPEASQSEVTLDDVRPTLDKPEAQFTGHVLIAEDSPANQLLISLLVKKLGLTSSLANNGAQAVELMQCESFDLVLMDLQMPVMSGIEATQAIRQFNKDVPVVALSADVLRHDRRSDEMAGFNEFLAKPIEMAKMCAVFERYLVSDVDAHGKSVSEEDVA